MSGATPGGIGDSVWRREDGRLLIGRGRYVADLPFEGALQRPDLVRDLGEPGLGATRYHSPDSVTWAAGVHVATVEVDGDTGAVTVLSYHAVHDAGHEINPLVVAGQTQGGAVQGIGMALTEEVVYESGQALTGTLMDYALPRADAVPGIEVIGVDSPSPLNPLGVKGTGEGSAVPGPAAIANAVADAMGGDANFTQIPLRADVVRAAARNGIAPAHRADRPTSRA